MTVRRCLAPLPPAPPATVFAWTDPAQPPAPLPLPPAAAAVTWGVLLDLLLTDVALKDALDLTKSESGPRLRLCLANGGFALEVQTEPVAPLRVHVRPMEPILTPDSIDPTEHELEADWTEAAGEGPDARWLRAEGNALLAEAVKAFNTLAEALAFRRDEFRPAESPRPADPLSGAPPPVETICAPRDDASVEDRDLDSPRTDPTPAENMAASTPPPDPYPPFQALTQRLDQDRQAFTRALVDRPLSLRRLSARYRALAHLIAGWAGALAGPELAAPPPFAISTLHESESESGSGSACDASVPSAKGPAAVGRNSGPGPGSGPGLPPRQGSATSASAAPPATLPATPAPTPGPTPLSHSMISNSSYRLEAQHNGTAARWFNPERGAEGGGGDTPTHPSSSSSALHLPPLHLAGSLTTPSANPGDAKDDRSSVWILPGGLRITLRPRRLLLPPPEAAAAWPLVFDDEPTSIIAHSLASQAHGNMLTIARERATASLQPQPPQHGDERGDGNGERVSPSPVVSSSFGAAPTPLGDAPAPRQLPAAEDAASCGRPALPPPAPLDLLRSVREGTHLRHYFEDGPQTTYQVVDYYAAQFAAVRELFLPG